MTNLLFSNEEYKYPKLQFEVFELSVFGLPSLMAYHVKTRGQVFTTWSKMMQNKKNFNWNIFNTKKIYVICVSMWLF